ncbi:hypothetical protein LNV09_14555 [Paucibacter sp. B2R-40]|uniref:hypothetical protein n=1 Tax=Paucibacter sp. B2R-40 TaxID=2893554 RepID=UPI0021E4BFDB|nr:hypothetical protein [Paucibacter sp. B2R-40]MCV2355372.1 hypothetical protein [Paucibacter sp. B2R-40]
MSEKKLIDTAWTISEMVLASRSGFKLIGVQVNCCVESVVDCLSEIDPGILKGIELNLDQRSEYRAGLRGGAIMVSMYEDWTAYKNSVTCEIELYEEVANGHALLNDSWKVVWPSEAPLSKKYLPFAAYCIPRSLAPGDQCVLDDVIEVLELNVPPEISAHCLPSTGESIVSADAVWTGSRFDISWECAVVRLHGDSRGNRTILSSGML